MERLPEGALAVVVDGRALKITNWDKVLFGEAGFTKGDLIAYYARVAPAVLPHLRDRPLTLKRYPNGVDAKYFYEKQSPSHRPEWVQTARIGGVNYTLAQDRATLVWLGQSGRRRAAHVAGVRRRTAAADDAGVRPRSRRAGRDRRVLPRSALVLRGLFDQIGLQCFAKTSGSKGMQVYLPLNTATDYAQTKPFARRIAELLEGRMPELVVSRMTKRLRSGKVLVDWSQNDDHKTTVTVYSVRARERPTVSTPVTLGGGDGLLEERDPELLTFETEQVLERVAEQGDLFAPLESLAELPAIGERIGTTAELRGRGHVAVRHNRREFEVHGNRVGYTRKAWALAGESPPAWLSATGLSRMMAGMDQITLRNRLLVATGMWREATGEPLPKLAPGDPADQIQSFELKLVDRLWETATPENARDVADRTWDLVHDRDDDDPVKQRVVECHQALARMTRLGD